MCIRICRLRWLCSSSKANARPPEKGSFPLDHFHECKTFMEKYMACMKRESNTHAACRDETKACVPRLPVLYVRVSSEATILMGVDHRFYVRHSLT